MCKEYEPDFSSRLWHFFEQSTERTGCTPTTQMFAHSVREYAVYFRCHQQHLLWLGFLNTRTLWIVTVVATLQSISLDNCVQALGPFPLVQACKPLCNLVQELGLVNKVVVMNGPKGRFFFRGEGGRGGGGGGVACSRFMYARYGKRGFFLSVK